MAVSRRRPGRTTVFAATTAALALAFCTLAGCSAVDTALDCVQTADSIADSVTDLRQAVQNAADDPAQADTALRSIENDLTKIGDKTDNADIDRAVDNLGKAVANVRTAIKNGDHTPDLTPVGDAAGELTAVCTP